MIGKAVVLTEGKAGTVENVWLDELHRLRISLKGHDRKMASLNLKLGELGSRHHTLPRARSLQNNPSKMKNPTSPSKVTLMIATVRNTSPADRGLMTMPRVS